MQSTEPVEDFDSGLVTGSEAFPLIDTTISIHGMFYFENQLADPAADRIRAIGRSWPGCMVLIGVCS